MRLYFAVVSVAFETLCESPSRLLLNLSQQSLICSKQQLRRAKEFQSLEMYIVIPISMVLSLIFRFFSAGLQQLDEWPVRLLVGHDGSLPEPSAC